MPGHSGEDPEGGQQAPREADEDVLDTWFSSGLWPFATLGGRSSARPRPLLPDTDPDHRPHTSSTCGAHGLS